MYEKQQQQQDNTIHRQHENMTPNNITIMKHLTTNNIDIMKHMTKKNEIHETNYKQQENTLEQTRKTGFVQQTVEFLKPN